MPTSDAWGKDWVRSTIENIHHNVPIFSVLDIGCGEGTYSDLLRPVLHSFSDFNAIEAWGPYVAEFNLLDKYDRVIVGDVRWLDDRMFRMNDLTILGDVLEHMTRDDAVYLLDKIFRLSRHCCVLICVPMLHLEQGPENGNPFEIHEMQNHYTETQMLHMLSDVMPDGSVVDTHVGDVVGYFLVRTGEYAEIGDLVEVGS